ncbi:hypothetical protein I7I53_12275 [Histoplasma capsulatum var. duboisii H88]|uniref:Uncharacterized protein n=1 Tax=Ajellomyces capsulatus (strain H88) TaxID=544711 RepID=A0A8A1M168_AJEC8|nr:hypothetical protein I7I53_12275 [Histoplasma capsulatum var. duboisii H88]
MLQSQGRAMVGNIPFQLPYIYRDRDIYIFKDDEVRINQVNNSTSYLFHSPSASRTGQRRERRCQTASRLDLVIQECERCADATCAIPKYGVLSVMRWATLSDQGGGVVYCIRT